MTGVACVACARVCVYTYMQFFSLFLFIHICVYVTLCAARTGAKANGVASGENSRIMMRRSLYSLVHVKTHDNAYTVPFLSTRVKSTPCDQRAFPIGKMTRVCP